MFKPKFWLGNKINQIKSDFVHLMNNFSVNDPTTPELKMEAPIPSVGTLKYAVEGMSPTPKTTNEIRAANCHFLISNCIENIQKHAKSPIKKWSSTNLLKVLPAAGADLNAFYDRGSLKFYYYNHNGKNTYFSDSADIVTHELGHAILDAIRPDFWSVQSLEVWSFHEAFSDIVAVFNIMSYEVALEKVLEQTKINGKFDLLISNSASRLAEEVGILIRSVTDDPSHLADALRNPATEKFKYIIPSSLPSDAPNDKLAAECHSFGRVFSNAWYNILARFFDHHVASGMKPIDSLRVSRDSAFEILLHAAATSARTINYYESVAKTMVSLAKFRKQDDYASIMNKVFLEWNIISKSELKILKNVAWRDVVRNLKRDDVVSKNPRMTTVCLKDKRLFRIKDLPIVTNLSINSNLSVEIASDTYYEFDEKGNLLDAITPNYDEIKQHAAECILGIANSVGKEKMWSVHENRLVRNFIS